MKKINKIAFMAALVFGLFTLNSCDKAKLVKVEKTLDGGNVEFIMAPQTSMDYDVTQSEIMDIAELIKPYSLTMDNIKSLVLESAEVEILDSNATPITFDVTDNMSVELATTTIAGSKIAFKDPVPHNALMLLPLDVQPGVDLIPFAKANDITYHLKLKLNKALTHAVKMKLSVKWKVTGEV